MGRGREEGGGMRRMRKADGVSRCGCGGQRCDALVVIIAVFSKCCKVAKTEPGQMLLGHKMEVRGS